MLKLRYILLTIILTSCAIEINAQDNELMIKLRTGHNSSFGGFAAFSLETAHNFGQNIQLSGGVQYSTIGRTALELRPSYTIDYLWGRMSAETLLSYRNLSTLNSYAFGLGTEISIRWLTLKLGYYYHLYGHVGERIKEPFNIYYELSAELVPTLESWDIHLIITNNEIFELERHYQPTFIAQCTHELTESLVLTMGTGYKPTGMFHLSADYYQYFLNLGLCYKW